MFLRKVVAICLHLLAYLVQAAGFAGVVLFTGALAVYLVEYYEARLLQGEHAGITTGGIKCRGEDGHGHQRVWFDFEVDGQPFEGSEPFGAGESLPRPGDDVRVRYALEDPRVCRLERIPPRREDSASFILGGVLGLLFLTLASVVLLFVPALGHVYVARLGYSVTGLEVRGMLYRASACLCFAWALDCLLVWLAFFASLPEDRLYLELALFTWWAGVTGVALGVIGLLLLRRSRIIALTAEPALGAVRTRVWPAPGLECSFAALDASVWRMGVVEQGGSTRWTWVAQHEPTARIEISAKALAPAHVSNPDDFIRATLQSYERQYGFHGRLARSRFRKPGPDGFRIDAWRKPPQGAAQTVSAVYLPCVKARRVLEISYTRRQEGHNRRLDKALKEILRTLDVSLEEQA